MALMPFEGGLQSGFAQAVEARFQWADVAAFRRLACIEPVDESTGACWQENDSPCIEKDFGSLQDFRSLFAKMMPPLEMMPTS